MGFYHHYDHFLFSAQQRYMFRQFVFLFKLLFPDEHKKMNKELQESDSRKSRLLFFSHQFILYSKINRKRLSVDHLLTGLFKIISGRSCSP